MLNNNKKAFTLVELIVVITILAILGTIAFISMQSYSESARNSTRLSDLSTMKTSLELFHLNSGKFPNPTGDFGIIYSGSTVWTQGTFGDITTQNIDKLDKIPTDPLTEKEYTYSLTSTKQEYQLSGLFEGDSVALNSALFNEANAGVISATAIVTGNYNGVLFKTLSGTNCEVLAVPSIVSALSSSISTNLIDIINSGALVYNGYKNLPTTYIDSKYDSLGGFDFNPASIVAYTDNLSCSPLFDASDDTARKNLILGLQSSYTGTIIKDQDIVANILSIDTNNDNEVSVLGSAIVNNSLGGNLTTSTTTTITATGTCVFGTSTFGNCIF